jgi:HK97 family phage portal protein
MMSSLFRPAEWLMDQLGVGRTSVNSHSINAIPAVWYALQKISGDIGKMPLEPRITRPDGRGSEPLRTHATYSLLRDQPNEYQTSDVFKELIQLHALSWGNGRAWINRNGLTPTELVPLLPDRTDTVMVEGKKFHCTMPEIDDPILFRDLMTETVASGKIDNKMIVLPDRDVLHIVGLGFDGVKGWNIGRVFEDVLSAGRAGHRLTRKQTEKGFTGKIMLSDTGGAFSGRDAQKEAEEFLEQFRKRYTNEADGEIAGMLRRGMTAEVLTMSNADAQLIEQMRFNRQDVMLIFGLQHIPGDSSATSYNSLEQKKLDTLESTNDRWMTRWEMQCDMKLRTQKEKKDRRIYFKFNAGSRLRTDIGTTAQVLSTLVRSTIMTRNEAREKLEMNPVDGGDEFVNPAIQVQEPSDQKVDQAQNKWRELVAVEAKRVLEIVGKKSLKDVDSALQKFYLNWTVTVRQSMNWSDDSVLLDHMKQLETAMVESKSVDEFRNKVSGIVAEWIE